MQPLNDSKKLGPPQAAYQKASPPTLLIRPSSCVSVLEPAISGMSELSESENGSPAQSPHGSPGGLPLLEAVMGNVCSAVSCGIALPHATGSMVEQLFPSASTISATVPSADGLGMAVVTLMQPRRLEGSQGSPATQRLAQPLTAGGVLSFGLAAQPPAAERQLMQAFAAELSTWLDSRHMQDLHCAPGQAAPLPHDCFWVSF